MIQELNQAIESFDMQNILALRLFVFVIFLLGLVPLQPVRAVQSTDNQKPKRGEFGSSLKNLEWDPEKRMAVEKELNTAVESQKARSQEVIKLETTLAVFSALVTDRNGKIISGLERNDFLVTEDGSAQEVTVFELGDNVNRPRSIVLLLEWSANAYLIPESLKAAEYFVSQLGPEDKVAIVTGNLQLICDFTKDKAELTVKLRELQERAKHGKSGLPAERFEFTTLFAVLRELIDEEAEQSIIIFQSDGGEAQVLRDQIKGDRPRYPSRKRQIGLADFDGVIERKRAAIYVVDTWYYCFEKDMTEAEHAQVILQAARRHRHSVRGENRLKQAIEEDRVIRRAMHHLAELSGGSVFCLEIPPAKRDFWGRSKEMGSLDHATSIYSRILATINQRYVIGYYPTNRARDGKRRRVLIQVRNHPEYIVRSRSYYYAPKRRS